MHRNEMPWMRCDTMRCDAMGHMHPIDNKGPVPAYIQPAAGQPECTPKRRWGTTVWPHMHLWVQMSPWGYTHDMGTLPAQVWVRIGEVQRALILRTDSSRLVIHTFYVPEFRRTAPVPGHPWAFSGMGRAHSPRLRSRHIPEQLPQPRCLQPLHRLLQDTPPWPRDTHRCPAASQITCTQGTKLGTNTIPVCCSTRCACRFVHWYLSRRGL